MKIVTTASELRTLCDKVRQSGKKVSFVPTMGALHEGHLALVDTAVENGDICVVSIFVNPTQFAPGEDLDKYPRTLEQDKQQLLSRGVDILFCPSVSEMYPAGSCTTVGVSGLTSHLCGAHRKGHFDGVTTVVAKFFNMVGPCSAVFGRKDFQQLQVISQMVRDLNMPINIIGVATVREPDGLAKSSRNAYLDETQRSRALCIPKGLTAAHQLFQKGSATAGQLCAAVEKQLTQVVDRIDYVTLADPKTLLPLERAQTVTKNAVLAVACYVGQTRLIDNTVLGQDKPPLESLLG